MNGKEKRAKGMKRGKKDGVKATIKKPLLRTVGAEEASSLVAV